MLKHTKCPAILFVITVFLSLFCNCANAYENLKIAVYFRYQEVHSTPANLERFASQWENVEKQLKVDKVYLETTRNNQLATESDVTILKKFFADRGIKVSAGLGLTVNEGNGFQSFCYSNKEQRDRVKEMVEFTAKYFDEIILDDFYFTNCKCDLCIDAKGDKSWTQFRTEQMDEVSKNLIINPAKKINPNVRIIIKYPNWYESFQGLGYDLAVQPKLFDAIYTGTETRNAEGGQRLQSYQSYLQTQYFNNIKPGGNQGGWIDGGGDARYAEQFWDTFFAKVPEITLFNSQQIMGTLRGFGGGGMMGGMGMGGARGGVQNQPDPNATLAGLMEPVLQPDGSSYTPDMVARTAGYSAELLDKFLGKLGKPIGLATYKPCNSVGEAYLPNYLGTIGVPIDLVPEFPENASTILLTAASKYDKQLVAKTKKFVQAGGRVIATTGLIEALGENGFQDIAEIEVTGHRVIAKSFGGGFGGFGGFGRGQRGGTGGQVPAVEPDLNILMPQMRHFENDTWDSIPFNTAASGYPMVIGTERSTIYGKGTFYAIAIPDDFADLYRLPQSVLNQIRNFLGRDIFVSLDAPDHVSLFAYDNKTFIVQNFKSQSVSTRVSVSGAARLHNLLTDEILTASQGFGGMGGRGAGFGGMMGGRGGMMGGRGGNVSNSASFDIAIPGNSFRVFQAE
ncbi:MAG: hypothetical protein JXA96_13315 [Sedimentisphaerales bacterium]|nr:hypothetical protein [Sedimentisphaerales bacterium]